MAGLKGAEASDRLRALPSAAGGALGKDLRIAIIGGGLSGLCMAQRLGQAGFHNFTIYEKADAIGGTWRDNVYPGVACDIPSQLYSFTFFRSARWSQMFAPGGEIKAYLERLARKFDLRRRIKFGANIVRCAFDGGKWHIETEAGECSTVDILISAAGFLHTPHYPDIAGLDSFKGPIFHSARWNHRVDLHGKRVANIGTGSSTAQIVPNIVDKVDRLLVFQRTPQWVFPMPNQHYSIGRKILWSLFPSLTMKMYDEFMEMFGNGFGIAVVGDKQQMKTFEESCRNNLAGIRDPELRRKLTPDYEVGCKRLVFSTSFYDALQKPNCDLVTDPIGRVVPDGIEMVDGTVKKTDVIILSTGFKAHDFFRSINISGKDGVTLDVAWRQGASSFESVTLAGFPNFFMIGGPHSTVGNLSFMACAEMQAGYTVRLLETLIERNAVSIAPRPEAQERFVDDMIRSARQSVWLSGCKSWYLNEHGHVAIWSRTPAAFVEMMKRGPLVEQDYDISP